MTVPSWLNGPPRKILLATDLSVRSDRALDRAVSLARQWQAHLVALHVLEQTLPNDSNLADPVPSWRRDPDRLSTARASVLVDLHGMDDKATILIEEGEPAETIVNVAEKHNCELIVIGVARNEMLGRFSLGRTVDYLARQSGVPLLVVKNRARGAYRHVVVATDFSESSRHALDAAAGFFPDQELIVFHAYEPPLAGRMADSVAHREDFRKVAEQDCEAFLRDFDRSKPGSRRPRVLIEYGAPSRLLHDYVVDRGADLAVIGTHGRSALLEVMIGSVAKTILDDVPCDILLIRRPQAT